VPWPPGFDPKDVPYPDLENIVTEDGAPVENIFIEKQYRLLTDPVENCWRGPGEGCPFLALTNVGLFYAYDQPPFVPDFMLSLRVVPLDPSTKAGRSYFVWLLGKVPEVIIEIVSDRRGGEEDFKMQAYARMGVLFYVIFDPENHLGGGQLRAFVLQRGKYEPIDPKWLPEVELGLCLWHGTYSGLTMDYWLRWCDAEGRLIPTGGERAQKAQDQAEEAQRQVEAAAEKVKRLEAQLRALGQEPET
jgi:hypothetical protein